MASRRVSRQYGTLAPKRSEIELGPRDDAGKVPAAAFVRHVLAFLGLKMLADSAHPAYPADSDSYSPTLLFSCSYSPTLLVSCSYSPTLLLSYSPTLLLRPLLLLNCLRELPASPARTVVHLRGGRPRGPDPGDPHRRPSEFGDSTALWRRNAPKLRTVHAKVPGKCPGRLSCETSSLFSA